MKQRLLRNLLFACVFLSCNSQEKGDENANPAGEEKEESDLSSTNCYQYATAADTIQLKLVKTGDSLTGTLVYKLKEKDSNKGTIEGRMQGNLLIADYRFNSEGVESTRQVAFKLADNHFTEGYGDTFTQNGKLYFKSLDSLKFNTSIKLTEVPCQ